MLVSLANIGVKHDGRIGILFVLCQHFIGEVGGELIYTPERPLFDSAHSLSDRVDVDRSYQGRIWNRKRARQLQYGSIIRGNAKWSKPSMPRNILEKNTVDVPSLLSVIA